jgi:DNA primase
LTKIDNAVNIILMSVWEDIKSRVSVEDVISEYIQIKPAGVNFRCVCPFHQEKNPSLIISPSKGIWHCFGCGAGGDIFKFVMDYENISKQETLVKLAKKAGIQLEELKPKTLEEEIISKSKVSRFEKGEKLLDWSANLYHTILLKILQDRSHPITQYCLERGLTQEIITQFKLGYAPKGNFLMQFSIKQKLDSSLLVDVGLIKISDNGEFRDKYSDRLMIPIISLKDKVVGFTGRVLPYDKTDRPKYLNSPQTEWFNKSNLWFGLNMAKKSIIQNKKALLVEGNMDVIAAVKGGFDYTIASQGTSFTEQQLLSLFKLTKHIHIAFDNDNAGKIAGNKLFSEALRIGFTVSKVIIPDTYKDLDEYIQAEKVTESELQVIPYMDYILKEYFTRLNSTHTDEQKKTILEVLDFMVYLDIISTEQYINRIFELTKLSKNTLEKTLVERRKNAKNTYSHSLDELDTEDSQSRLKTEQNKVASILIAFQNLLLNSSEPEVLADLFILLKEFLPQFGEYNTLESYISDRKDELDLIVSLGEVTNMPSEQKKTLMLTIQSFLDQNINNILLNEQLYSIYMGLKRLDNIE